MQRLLATTDGSHQRGETERHSMNKTLADSTSDPMFEAIENGVVDVIESCIGVRGFKLPVFVVGASADGCVFAARFERTSRGVETVPLTFRRSGAAFEFPINLMVCDSAASVPAQAVIRGGEATPEFVH